MENFTWKKTNAPTMVGGGRTDDIWFIDSKRGWAVNSNGQVLSTNDGGQNWNEQLRLNNIYLRCISFSDAKHGWLGTLTSSQRMFVTNDGGKVWSEVNNLPSQPSAICGIYAVSNNTIYASGTNYPNRQCAVLKTIDGGKSWAKIDMSPYANLLVDIYFKDENIGWVVGGVGGTTRDKVKPVVLFTEDGGKSWINQVSSIQDEFPFGEWGWKIQFVNDMIGFISLENFKDGAVVKTTDGGKNWIRLRINDLQKNANLEGIGFLDENIGWVGGWGDKDFKGGYTSQTNDGGLTWANANEVGKYLNRFRFVGQPLEVVYASGDTIYKFSDKSEIINIPTPNLNLVSQILLNRDSEIYRKDIPLMLNIPEQTKNLSINIWDRFGEHISTLLNEENPSPGKKTFVWTFPNNSDELSLNHYILRVNTEKEVESRVIIHSSDKTHNSIVDSLRDFTSNNIGVTGNFPNVEQEKEAFFRIVNIEDFPEFLPIAKDLATIYLANTDYSSPLFNKFSYTDENFEKRMAEIYDAALPSMHKPHRYDKDVIEWENGKKYKIGKASDKVAKDRILQMAPFNLMDGFWLQNIMQARPSDEIRSRLFSIWSDEAGNGDTNHNHSNIYLDMLRSQGFFLPDVSSRDFLDIDVAPGAWRSPVFEMCIGLFPQHFFPELLGMTLYLEWEATPTMPPIANMFKGRGINPLFYSLHAAIDNIDEGHGALAKQAIKIFLDEKREEGGDRAVQENWERIWNGYVGWATAGNNGEGIEERRLLIDKVSINIGTKEEPICFPDWKLYYKSGMINMIQKKAPYAKQVHGSATIGGVLLNKLFDDPQNLIEKLLSSGLFDIEFPRNSKFFDLLAFEGPMYKVFTEEEKNIILDWLESLSKSFDKCIEPLEEINPEPSNIFSIIENFIGLARRAHDQLTLPDNSGNPQPLITFLDSPKSILKAMIRGGWIIPGSSERSMFIDRILSNDGPMQGVFDENQIKSFTSWIDAGAVIPEITDNVNLLDSQSENKLGVVPMNFVGKHANISHNIKDFTTVRAFIGQGAVH